MKPLRMNEFFEAHCGKLYKIKNFGTLIDEETNKTIYYEDRSLPNAEIVRVRISPEMYKKLENQRMLRHRNQQVLRT